MLQADVWRFYTGPSLFGQEVVTLGGPRGPAASYYLPYLSAVQLFAPAPAREEGGVGHSGEGKHPPALGDAQSPRSPLSPPAQQLAAGSGSEGGLVYSYPGGLEEWPAEMEAVFQWSAGGHVGERIPLGPQLDALCGPAGPAHLLRATRLADLHPYSW